MDWLKDLKTLLPEQRAKRIVVVVLAGVWALGLAFFALLVQIQRFAREPRSPEEILPVFLIVNIVGTLVILGIYGWHLRKYRQRQAGL